MNKLATALIAAGCLGLICPAVAAQQQQEAGLSVQTVRAMDANRNGNITQEEFLNESDDSELFAQLDTNADGVLDIDEIRTGIRVPIRISN